MGQLTWVALAGTGAAGLVLGLLAPQLWRRLQGKKGPLQFVALEASDGEAAHGPSRVLRHLEWQPPQKQPPPYPLQPSLSFDPSTSEASVLYPLIISSVVPRPIAFVSTLSKDGVGNLSPYSYFNAVNHSPPVLAMGHCWSKGKPKDSLQNILDTKEMVVCIISEWFLEAANHTCGAYDPSINEMELSGLTPLPSEKVKPPRVAESAIHFECKLLHHYDLQDRHGNTTCTVVLAEAVLIHVAESVTTRTPQTGKVIVDPEKLKPMCRLGGNTYGAGLEYFDVPRPDGEGRYPGSGSFVPSDRDRMLGKK